MRQSPALDGLERTSGQSSIKARLSHAFGRTRSGRAFARPDLSPVCCILCSACRPILPRQPCALPGTPACRGDRSRPRAAPAGHGCLSSPSSPSTHPASSRHPPARRRTRWKGSAQHHADTSVTGPLTRIGFRKVLCPRNAVRPSTISVLSVVSVVDFTSVPGVRRLCAGSPMPQGTR